MYVYIHARVFQKCGTFVELVEISRGNFEQHFSSQKLSFRFGFVNELLIKKKKKQSRDAMYDVE